MRLCQFIQAHPAEIISDWERALRESLPAAERLSRPALINHVPRLLQDFAAVIEARGERPSLENVANAHADEHAFERIEQGFMLSHVVHELSVLRKCILARWRVVHPNVNVDDAELLTSVVDRAIERAVDRYFELRTKRITEVRTLVDNMPELCWMAQPDGYIDFYNRRWYEYTGTTPEEMCGWGWQKVHDPEVLPDVVARWQEAIATGEALEMEFPLRAADGTFHWFLTRAVPVRDESGRVFRWLGVNTNIDEQHRLRRELHYALDDLKRTAEFRERFLGIVSHDLRNPMNAIAMSAGAILKRPELPTEVAKPATRILVHIERMSRMVSDLLDFTRGRLGGGIPVAPGPADLGKIARRVLDEFEQAHASRRIECEAHGDTQGTWDADRLAQLLGNLLLNALHHGAEDGVVSIRVDGTEEDRVTLSVHNDGPPIPADALPHIFEPFRQGKRRTSPQGLGLGLFIVCEITRAHRGNVHVTSDEHGTTFFVSLPRHALAHPRPSSHPPGPGGHAAP